MASRSRSRRRRVRLSSAHPGRAGSEMDPSPGTSSADVLSALDAFEQERVIGIFGDLEEGRDRRQQVGNELLDDRHERAAPGELLEFFKRRDLHVWQTPKAGSALRCA